MSALNASELTKSAPWLLWALPLTIATVGIWALYRWLLPKPLPGIPYDLNAAKSIWGDAPALRDDPDGLAKWSSKHLERLQAPLCQVLMGPLSKPIIVVADVGNVRDILTGRSDFDRSSYIIDRLPLFGEFHLRMMTGEDWRTSRAWLKDMLTPKYLHNVAAPAIHASVLQLIELWQLKNDAANGKPFNMVGDLKSLALDAVLAFHFSDDFKDSALTRQVDFMQGFDRSKIVTTKHGDALFPQAEMHDFPQGLTEVGDRITAIYATRWPPVLVSWWERYMNLRLRHFFVSKDGFIRQYIDLALQRSRKNEEAKTGMDHMVYREDKASAKAGRKPLYASQIMIDEAYGNLIAGQHTTSAALVWTLKLLADYPAVQTKLREELHNVWAEAFRENRLPSTAEIVNAKTPYLEAVLEETLRLRAAFVVPRDATRNTELLGHMIPKGTVVLLICQGPEINVSGESKPSRRYPGHSNQDLEVFDPERWLIKHPDGTLEFDGSSYPQLAFGMGIRACWGRKFAHLEMRIMTVMLTWQFDFLQLKGQLASHAANYDLSYRAKQGYVQLRSRGKFWSPLCGAH